MFILIDAIAHNLNGENGNMDCRGKVGTPREHQQMIVAPNGMIVTSPENMGTYDFVSPSISKRDHFTNDVAPWIIWGNSENDTTSGRERSKALLKGLIKYYFHNEENDKNNGTIQNERIDIPIGGFATHPFYKTPAPWFIHESTKNNNITPWKRIYTPVKAPYNYFIYK